MAYIDFKKLKGRVPITDLLAHYGLLDGLEETSQGYEGSCPFCGGGSFKVNVERNVWFCFGECKETTEGRGAKNGGNILDFVVRKEGVSVQRAAQKIAAWFKTEGGTAGAKEPEPKAVAPANGGQARAPAPPAASEGQGSAPSHRPTSPPAEASGAEDLKEDPPEDLTGRSNAPLEFTLKSITFEHPVLEGLGLSQATLAAFGVGYFTGKGMMRNKVVIPFHNADGLLVAYAGYSPETRTYTYPKGFDPRLELYNVWRVANTGLGDDLGVVLVTDLLNVLRLHELGVTRALAMPTETPFPPQLRALHSLVGAGGKVDLAPSSKEYVDTLAELLPHFHVRLHRHYEEREDEFLREIVSSLGW